MILMTIFIIIKIIMMMMIMMNMYVQIEISTSIDKSSIDNLNDNNKNCASIIFVLLLYHLIELVLLL